MEGQFNEIRVFELRFRESEEKVALLSQEIERLNQNIRFKMEEIDGWKVKYSKMEIQINEMRIYEGRSQEYEQRISHLIKELDDWRIRYHNIEI